VGHISVKIPGQLSVKINSAVISSALLDGEEMALPEQQINADVPEL